MSEHEFHVHGPHDHELEHAAHAGHDGDGKGRQMVARIAVTTAIIATIGVLFSFMGGTAQEEAGLFKSNVEIKQTEAAEQWNYYMGKSVKLAVSELARDLAPEDKKAGHRATIDRYEAQMAEIKAAATKLDAEARQWDKSSEEMLRQHRRWAQATAVLQIAIAMAAIALLTRKKWIEQAMFALVAIGLLVGTLALWQI